MMQKILFICLGQLPTTTLAKPQFHHHENVPASAHTTKIVANGDPLQTAEPFSANPKAASEMTYSEVDKLSVYKPSGKVPGSIGEHIGMASYLCALPAGMMLIGSVIALFATPPKTLSAMLQHFAAGIVISSVAVELLPKITEKGKSAGGIAGMIIGFIVGVAVMILMKMFCGSDDEEEEAEQETSLTERMGLASAEAKPEKFEKHEHTEQCDKGCTISPPGFPSVTSYANEKRLMASGKKGGFPWAFYVAVQVDSFVDGLLIGIASAAGGTTGWVIAVSLCVEMCFLGINLSTVMQKLPKRQAILATCVGPIVIMASGILGAAISQALKNYPDVYVALLSFGVAALLYLVTEELLLEAHSNAPDEHIWYVDLMFFVGFLVSLIVEMVTNSS